MRGARAFCEGENYGFSSSLLLPFTLDSPSIRAADERGHGAGIKRFSPGLLRIMYSRYPAPAHAC